jgi:hypothetical protein
MGLLPLRALLLAVWLDVAVFLAQHPHVVAGDGRLLLVPFRLLARPAPGRREQAAAAVPPGERGHILRQLSEVGRAERLLDLGGEADPLGLRVSDDDVERHPRVQSLILVTLEQVGQQLARLALVVLLRLQAVAPLVVRFVPGLRILLGRVELPGAQDVELPEGVRPLPFCR